MSWRERLRRASFRGVPFQFEETGDQVGRWNVRHDFPGRALPFVEDMGVRAREFRIRAYLVGQDYLEQLDRLLGALEAEGPGELVHPTLGTRTVSLLEPARVQQSNREGGLAQLELTFVESEGAASPISAAIPGPALEDLSEAHADAAAALYPDLVIVDDQPEIARESIAQSAAAAADVLSRLDLPAPSQDLAAWRERLNRITSQGASLAAEPTLLAFELRGVIGDVADLAGGRLPALEAYQALLRLPRIVVPGRGSSALIAAGNARSTDNLTHFLAFAGATGAVSRATWTSLDQALAARADLLASSEELEGELDARDLARLHELRGLLAAAVPPPNRGLPRERDVVPPLTQPSLVLAYQLDGDVAGEADLVERNRPRYPGFLPGGLALEVLERV